MAMGLEAICAVSPRVSDSEIMGDNHSAMAIRGRLAGGSGTLPFGE